MSETTLAPARQSAAPGARPVNPDGTTNWAVVFDDPERGILAAVGATTSSAQLEPVIDGVAGLLFKRKHDAELRAAFRAEIQDILDSDGLQPFDGVKAQILARLEKERSDRIEKAALYAKNKAAAQSIERRRDGPRTGVAALFANPRIGVTVLAALLVVVLGVGLWVLTIGTEEVADSSAAPAPAPDRSRPADPSPSPAAPLQAMIAFTPVSQQVTVGGTPRRLTLVPMFPVRPRTDVEDFCALAPWIAEGVTLGVHALDGLPRPLHAADIGDIAARVRADLEPRARGRGLDLPPLRLLEAAAVPEAASRAARGGCVSVRIEPTS